MAISFKCRGCGASYSVKDEFGGKKTRCKKCNEPITIPAAVAADLDPPEIGFLDDEPRYSAPAPSAPSAPERSIYSSPSRTNDSEDRMPLRAAPLAPPSLPSANAPRRHTSIHDANPRQAQKYTAQARPTDGGGGGGGGAVKAGAWLYILGIGGCILPMFGYQFKILIGLGNGAIFAAFILTLIATACMLAGRAWVLGGIGFLVGAIAFGIALVSYEPVADEDQLAAKDMGRKQMDDFSARMEADRQASRDRMEQMRRNNEEMSARMRANHQSIFGPRPDAPSSGGGASGPSPEEQLNQARLRVVENYRQEMERDANRYVQGGAREGFEEDIVQVRSKFARYSSEVGNMGEFEGVRHQMTRIEEAFNGLQSREPDAAIYQPVAGGESWDPAPVIVDAFTPEVTILQGWNLRLPSDARMNLSGDTNTSVLWKSPDGSVRMKIELIPREVAKQQRPWVIVPSLSLEARRTGLAYIISDGHASTTGSIQQLMFTRGVRTPSATVPIAAVKYMALVGNTWLSAEISAGAHHPEWFGQFENAIRTLRPLKSGEAATDPLSPQFVISRLADAPEEAGNLLRKAGPAAEDVVLAAATDAAHPQRALALGILADVGTPKSSPLLWELSTNAEPTIYKAARAALLKLEPGKANRLDFALADLALPAETNSPLRKREALVALAECKPDQRKAATAATLERMLLDPAEGEIANEIGKALFTWNRPETFEALMPALGDPAFEQRPALDAILLAASGTSDKRAALSILRWVLKRPQAVSDACVVLGAPAEDELLKVLAKEPAGRGAACDILGRMGTERSVYLLDKTSKAKDSSEELRTKAKAALTAVKTREAEKKAKKA